MRYAFFLLRVSINILKAPVKNSGRQCCLEGFNSGFKGLNQKISFFSSVCVFLMTCRSEVCGEKWILKKLSELQLFIVYFIVT